VAHAEASARTVEAAVTAAAAKLGLRSDQVDIEVLEDPVPSTFGFIGSPAQVRVTPRTSSNAPSTSGSGGSGSTDAGSAGSGSAGAGSAGAGAGSAGFESTGSGSTGSGSPDLGPTDVGRTGSTDPRSTGSWSVGSRPTDSGPAGSGPTDSGPAGQPIYPRSPEAPQAPDPALPLDPAHTPEPDQAARPAQAAASTAPADLTQTPDPTGTPSGTGSTPDAGTGIPSAREVSGHVPATASGPTTAVEPASSLAGAPSIPAAQPAPPAAVGDQAPATAAAQGEQPSESTSGADDPAPAIGTPATGPTATATVESEGDGAPSATTEPSIATRPSRRAYRDEPIEPAMVEADTERAGDFLEGLLDALDVDGDITTWVDEVGGHIDLEGPDLDMLVGSNGETLDALQELTRLAVLRQSKRRVRLLLDINGFRARQRERLVSVVRATAEQVIKSQEDHEFQPMTPAERKIVHDAVAAIDGVTTESLGEEPNRRVIIQPT
jgi:spoIIIJ-associated protein